MKRKNKTKLLMLITVILLTFSFCVRRGDNTPPLEIENRDVVLGIDVSRYQGNIDFESLYNQGARFVFIKATEGVTHMDPNFYVNWRSAHATDMRVGAYHFFRFESDGNEQANNFIEHVEVLENSLPPVLDVEYYGDFIHRPMAKGEVIDKLEIMVERLRDHYGKYPIIYCNRFVYDAYIRGNFTDCDIWYRSIDTDFPVISDGREWTFWQYDDKGLLEGYEGGEKHIDLNYFRGNLEELMRYSN